jgi:hypothetical protein
MAAMKQLAADLLPKLLKKPPKSDGSKCKLPKKHAVTRASRIGLYAPPMADLQAIEMEEVERVEDEPVGRSPCFRRRITRSPLALL